jgi:hypothetical protein
MQTNNDVTNEVKPSSKRTPQEPELIWLFATERGVRLLILVAG